MPASALPDIFQFTDFREFLRARYEAAKAGDMGFSQRYIAEAVGATSTGWFSDIIKGRITLTPAYRLKLAKLFRLRPNEEDFFETLVNFEQAGSSEEKNRHLAKLLAFKELKADVLGKDQFEYYAKWYHAAIRELLLFHAFRGDYAELGKRLSPPISAAQAKKAMGLLERLGLVAEDENGIHRPTASILKKDPAHKSLHLANFLRAYSELGIEALERYEKEERDISALTLALAPADFEKAKEEIKLLRKKLLALSEKPGLNKRVYQCNFQVFPITGEGYEK